MLEEELGNARLSAGHTQRSESYRAVQSVISNLMQIARPYQEVPAAASKS